LVSVGRISELAEEDHFENFVARESIRFLRNHGKKQPFFLLSSFLKPHDPWMPAERFAQMFHAQDMKLPETWGKVDLSSVPHMIGENIRYNWATPELRHPEVAKVRIALYYASLAQMDDNVGKLLRALQALELDRDTIVLYTSDHGEMLGAHGLWQKFVFYEPSAGVPLIFRVPGMTLQKAHCATPVSLVQVLPTLLELCGLPTPSGLDGNSLTTNLREPWRKMDSVVFAEHELGSSRPRSMIRSGDYKYCYYVDDMDELYDLKADPQEMKNLALLPEYRGKRDELKKILFAWHRPE